MIRHICISKGYSVVLCGRAKPVPTPGKRRIWVAPITLDEYRDRQAQWIDGPFCKQCVNHADRRA